MVLAAGKAADMKDFRHAPAFWGALDEDDEVDRIADDGLHRLLAHMDEIMGASVIIAIAQMPIPAAMTYFTSARNTSPSGRPLSSALSVTLRWRW